jgi:alpha-tubulin suppressor-like RCC1 family protein
MGAVNCGGFFTMALTLEGQLWSWGGMPQYLAMLLFNELGILDYQFIIKNKIN